ncbi:hypothetical protein SF2A35B_1495 [Lactiplantibacillus plantarum]|nr:hypothetical protein SF2A35B_1495 [Lactiplantibacillus plantarum]
MTFKLNRYFKVAAVLVTAVFLKYLVNADQVLLAKKNVCSYNGI